jgi:hypothetical protein
MVPGSGTRSEPLEMCALGFEFYVDTKAIKDLYLFGVDTPVPYILFICTERRLLLQSYPILNGTGSDPSRTNIFDKKKKAAFLMPQISHG